MSSGEAGRARSIPHNKAVHGGPVQVVDGQGGLAVGPQGLLVLPGVNIAVLPLDAHYGDQVWGTPTTYLAHRLP